MNDIPENNKKIRMKRKADDDYFYGLSFSDVISHWKKFMNDYPLLTECNPLRGVDKKKNKHVYEYLDDTSRTCYTYGWYNSLGTNCFLDGGSISSVLKNNVLSALEGLGSIGL